MRINELISAVSNYAKHKEAFLKSEQIVQKLNEVVEVDKLKKRRESLIKQIQAIEVILNQVTAEAEGA